MWARQHPKRGVVLIAVLCLVAGAACAENAPQTTTSPTTTASVPTETTTTLPPSTTAPDTSTTSTMAPTTTMPLAATAVYFVLEEIDPTVVGPLLVPVHRDVSEPTLAATIEALLEGTTMDERDGIPGMTSDIPAGTTLLGITVSGGIADIDLNGTFNVLRASFEP